MGGRDGSGEREGAGSGTEIRSTITFKLLACAWVCDIVVSVGFSTLKTRKKLFNPFIDSMTGFSTGSVIDS